MTTKTMAVLAATVALSICIIPVAGDTVPPFAIQGINVTAGAGSSSNVRLGWGDYSAFDSSIIGFTLQGKTNLTDKGWVDLGADVTGLAARDASGVEYLFNTANQQGDTSEFTFGANISVASGFRFFKLCPVLSEGAPANITAVMMPKNGGRIAFDSGGLAFKAGDVVTITMSTNPGFNFIGLLIYDDDGMEVELYNNMDGTFTFIMPDLNVTILVVFASVNPNAMTSSMTKNVARLTGYAGAGWSPEILKQDCYLPRGEYEVRLILRGPANGLIRPILAGYQIINHNWNYSTAQPHYMGDPGITFTGNWQQYRHPINFTQTVPLATFELVPAAALGVSGTIEVAYAGIFKRDGNRYDYSRNYLKNGGFSDTADGLAGLNDWHGDRAASRTTGPCESWTTSGTSAVMPLIAPVSITSHPQYTTAEEGAIVESLSATAASGIAGALRYQWYQSGKADMAGKVAVGGDSATLAIPPNLMAGTYYFHCVASVAGIGVFPATSRAAQVVVNAPDAPNALASKLKNVAYIFFQGTAWQPEALVQHVHLPADSYDVRVVMKASVEGTRVRPLLCQAPSNSSNYNTPPYYLWSAPTEPNNAIILSTEWTQYRYEITTTAPVSTFQLIPMNGGPNGYIQCSFIGIFDKKGGGYDYSNNHVVNGDFADGVRNVASWQGIRNNNLTTLGPVTIWNTSLQAAPIPAVVTPTITLTTQPEDADLIQDLIMMDSLSVAAYLNVGGENSLRYQWYQGGSTVANPPGDTMLLGETDVSFAIPNDLMGGVYYFYCVVSALDAGAASVVSRVATVTVDDRKAILITNQPQNMTVMEDYITETLSVTAASNDGGTLGYQWYQGGSATPNPAVDMPLGATTTIAVPDELEYGVHYFYCIVNSTGEAPAATSGVAVVTVTLFDPNALNPMTKNIAYVAFNGTGWLPEALVQHSLYLPPGDYDVRLVMKAENAGTRVRPLLCSAISDGGNWHLNNPHLWVAPQYAANINDPKATAIILTTDWAQYRYETTIAGKVSVFQLIPASGGPNGNIYVSHIGIFAKHNGHYDYKRNLVINGNFTDGFNGWIGMTGGNAANLGAVHRWSLVSQTAPVPAVVKSGADMTVADNKPQGYDYNVYYGMLHSHSTLSDGSGTPAQAYEYARDVAMLDFFSLADHNHYMIDNPVAMDTLRQAAAAANRSGGFAALAGWEWTNYTIGHMTVVNDPRGNAEYLSISDDVWFSMNKIYGWLSVNDAVAFFNHPGWCDAVGPGEATPYSVEFNHFAYDARVADKIVGMELWNTEVARYGWDTAGFQAYFYDKGYDKSSNGKGFYDDALLKGWRVGAGGSDDTHLVNWGMTTRARLAVLAEELTPVAIYTALQERRFYSTLDHNLSLSFTINGHEMGSVLYPGVHNMLIRANNRNREYFTKVQLYKNGALENTWNIHTQNVEITDELATADGDFYYVKVTQADNDEAISSPIWINTNGK